MRRDLIRVILFFILISLKSVTTDDNSDYDFDTSVNIDNCTIILDAYSMDTQKIPCNHSSCQYHIKTTSSEPIELIIDPNHFFHKYLIVWETFYEDGVEQRIIKMWRNMSGSHDELTFISGVNQSFIFEAGFPCTFTLPTFKYNRINKDKVACNPILSYVGHNITTIQEGDVIDGTEMCPYRLKREIDSDGTNDTEYLYIVAFGSHTQDADLYSLLDHDMRHERSLLIQVANWSQYEIVTTAYDSDTNEDRRSSFTIQAVSSRHNCTCGEKTNVVDVVDQVLTLRSPGYPDFGCPNLYCKASVYFPRLKNPAAPRMATSRVMVSMKTQFRDGINLTVLSKSVDFSFAENSYSNISTSFLIGESDLRIHYVTPQMLSTRPEGHYEMNFTRVLIKRGCECSLFGSRLYTKDWSGEINIPAHCDLVFCSWTLLYKGRKQVNITLLNVNDDDEVHIWNRDVMEVYTGDSCKYKRSMYLPDGGDSHIAFWRKSKGLNAKIILSWEFKYFHYHHHMCDFEYNITTAPMTILSHNYPSIFYASEDCTYRLRAPKNHTVEVSLEEVDIEDYFDHITFYDGPSSKSQLLKDFTGKFKNQMIFATGNEMFVMYRSNNQGAGRGYHFNAYAVPNIDVAISEMDIVSPDPVTTSTTSTTATPVTTTERPAEKSYFWTTAIIIILLLALCGILVAGAVYWRRRRDLLADRVHFNSMSLDRLRIDSESEEISVSSA